MMTQIKDDVTTESDAVDYIFISSRMIRLQKAMPRAPRAVTIVE